jgi:hypothetical protein
MTLPGARLVLQDEAEHVLPVAHKYHLGGVLDYGFQQLQAVSPTHSTELLRAAHLSSLYLNEQQMKALVDRLMQIFNSPSASAAPPLTPVSARTAAYFPAKSAFAATGLSQAGKVEIAQFRSSLAGSTATGHGSVFKEVALRLVDLMLGAYH